MILLETVISHQGSWYSCNNYIYSYINIYIIIKIYLYKYSYVDNIKFHHETK